MAKYLMGIDNGATVSKAALFTLDGKEVGVASEKTEMLTPRPGFAERDMLAMWKATADSIKKVIAQAKVDPGDICCIACTGYGNGLYLVDSDGAPVRNAIIWSVPLPGGFAEQTTTVSAEVAGEAIVRPNSLSIFSPLLIQSCFPVSRS